jgi:hypothetical protein
MVPNLVTRWVPMPLTTVMITTEIPVRTYGGSFGFFVNEIVGSNFFVRI